MSLEAPLPPISIDDCAGVPVPTVAPRADAASTDRDLLDRVARGDVTAFDRAVARYWPPLIVYVAGALRSHDAAEDVVQETFLRLWERRDRLRIDGSLRGFLYQVAHNLAISEQRRVRARARTVESVRAEEPRFAEPVDTGGDVLDASLAHAIDGLPPRRREILLLRSVHGLSYKEIAATLGIAPQTVANQFSTALSGLRRVLSHLLP
jgi:RNA polymerase sigma-70 factor (ECF subfamily)